MPYREIYNEEECLFYNEAYDMNCSAGNQEKIYCMMMDMKEEFKQKLSTLTVLKRPCIVNYRPVVRFYFPNWGLML